MQGAKKGRKTKEKSIVIIKDWYTAAPGITFLSMSFRCDIDEMPP